MYLHLAENQAQTCPSDWANPRTWHPAGRQTIRDPGIPPISVEEVMNICVRGGKRSRACLGKFLERSATLTVTVIVSYKTLLSLPSLYNYSLLSLQPSYTESLIYEIPAKDEVESHNKIEQLNRRIVQPTTHAMQTLRVVGALQKPVAVYRHSSSPLFCDVLLLCPISGPLAITAAQFSE